MSRYRYIVTSSGGAGIGADPFEHQAENLVKYSELDPTITLDRVTYSKAGGPGHMRAWIAWRVAAKHAQAVVDAITYDNEVDPIPFNDVTLDEHDVEVFDTRHEAVDRLNEACDGHFFSHL